MLCALWIAFLNWASDVTVADDAYPQALAILEKFISNPTVGWLLPNRELHY